MSQPQYKLTYFDARGIAEPFRWIFAYAKVPFEDVRLPMSSTGLTDEKKAELGLPWNQIPTLEIDGKKFGQSLAISRYLARKYKLVGQDEFEEFKCDEIVDLIFRDYFPKWKAIAMLKFSNTDESKIREALQPLLEVENQKELNKFNKILEESQSGWLVGKSLTWADIYVAHFITHWETIFKVEFVELTKNYPALQKLVDKVQNTPQIPSSNFHPKSKCLLQYKI